MKSCLQPLPSLLLGIAALCWCLGLRAQPAYLTQQLVAHYPFTHSFHPAVGNVSFRSEEPPDFLGTPSGGIEFNGIRQYLAAGPFEGFLNRQREYSITFFLRSELTSAFTPLIYNEGPHSAYFGISIIDNSRIQVTSYGGFPPRMRAVSSDPIDLSRGAWISMVFRTDPQGSAAGNLWFYVDGVQQVRRSHFKVDQNLGTASVYAAVGAHTATYTPRGVAEGTPAVQHLKGGLRSLRIYQRALSGIEIAGLYQFESELAGLRIRPATAIPQVVNGFVVGVDLIDGGYGYTEPPVVRISGSGTGAIARAVVGDGRVTAVQVVDPGRGFTNTTRVIIGSPTFDPTLAMDVSRVRLTLKVVLGGRYVVERTTESQDWIALGDPFTAENEKVVMEVEVKEAGQQFRVRQVP